MRIAKAEFRRVRIPFKRRFDHATASRESADRLYITLEGEAGHVGFGEIMPRAYLTGETLEDIFETSGPQRAGALIGRHFADSLSVITFLTEALCDAGRQLALAGGIEGALLNLAEQELGLDYGQILGSPRTTPVGRCVTIGLVDDPKKLRRHAIEARMAKATVVKVKVSGDQDADRVKVLQAHLGDLPIRLDANGALSFEEARDLLRSLRETRIASFEQPLKADAPDLAEKLRALFEEFRVPIMADESICSEADAEIWGRAGAYQLVNVRVGKCGGLIGARRVIDAAARFGLGVVGGTLVGESGVLDRYGGILLSRRDEMPYMEGLGQARWLLEGDPTVLQVDVEKETGNFHWNIDQLKQWQVGTTIQVS